MLSSVLSVRVTVILKSRQPPAASAPLLSLTLHREGRARADVLPPRAWWPPAHRGAVIDPAVVHLQRADEEICSIQPEFVRTLAQVEADVVVFLD